ncbi:pyridoxamine 5'-phosphate oxidase family protein [Polycladidibacter hongkongensis]|uniref:pyridoxamine 5'-phosphate oxidase family protein n=1 Tax=Polycladidibacter hongkongensis TaxID=1647556 RepID=UPI000832021C|nr:pyridoxamine 5'-phosphate oxidase family protein [Pseudovibrio hongkongensis]
MQYLESIAELEELYGACSEASLAKEVDYLLPSYKRFIEASPFVAMATVGPEGMDCSPRGDAGQVVTIENDRCLLLPDRRGNNRIDSLRNILMDDRISLMFMVPGSNSVLRVNGRGRICAEPQVLERFCVQGKLPRSVLVVAIEAVYFQCARAVMRAQLWDPKGFVGKGDLPSAGDMLREATQGAFDGASYDAAWPARAKESMW